MGRSRLAPTRETLHHAQETEAFAEELSRQLKPNDLVLLTGDLGAGKTTFVKGLAKALGSLDLVQSPTFVYLQIYEAPIPLFHFDLYRFSSPSDFLSMGFEEYFQSGGITAIEWPERISELLPADAIHLHFETLSPNMRTVTVNSWGDR